MRKLCFFAVVWLVHGAAFGYGDLLSNTVERSNLETQLDRIVEDYLSSLRLAHSHTLSRSKRDLSLKSLLTDDKGVYRLQTVTPVSHLCSPALFSQFLDIANDTYAVCASAVTNDNFAEVIVGLYKERKWIPQNRWYVSDPTGIAAFHFNGYIYVLVADISREGVDLIRINVATKEMNVDHTVYSKYTTSISIWKMKVYGTFHMALGNSPRQQDPNNFQTEVFIYKWKDTYYDRYATLQAYDVKDIEPFHIHGAAYLAIANFRRGKYNYEADSEILKYDLDRKTWMSHQKIRTYGATDWEFFTLGSNLNKEFYLAVANKESHSEYKGMSGGNSVIYKFVKDQFVPFQCLPTPNALSIASWSTEGGFLLALAGFEAVHLYQYDGWNFVLSSAQYTRESMSYGVNHLIFHTIRKDDKRIPILSVSNPRHPRDLSIYELDFQYSNSLRGWNEKSTEWCLNTMNRIESTSTESVIGLLEDVVFIDQPAPITINGSLVFQKGFETEKLKTPHLKEIVTEEVYDDNMLHNLKGLKERLQGISAQLDRISEVLENSLKIDGNQTIYGRLEFQDVSFDCKEKSCGFDSLLTTKLNGEDIGDWANNLVFLNSDQLISGPIFCEKIQADSIIVKEMIDGVYSQDLVTKVGNHNITTPKTFQGFVTASDLQVDGLVDGVEILPTNVLLTTSYQNIVGRLTFDNMEASWVDVNGLVNGIDLSKFYKDVVLSDQSANIPGEKIFHNVVVDDLFMTPESSINGIDIVDLWNNALWTERIQEMKAPITFESVTMQRNLDAFMGINEIQIPGPRVVDINNPAIITEHHIFERSTKIAELNVLESLNEIGTFKIPGRLPQLDMMLKTGNQIATGKKTFHTIHLDADSLVAGTVDGVDLSEFKSLALQRNPVVDSNRTWLFNNLVIKGSLFANKTAGYDLEHIYEKALKLGDKDIPEITFKEVVHIKELESRNINGLDIENDLVLLNIDQDITGKKEFANIVLEDNSFVLGEVNNINLNFLNETILRIGNQVLKSKVFNRDVKFQKLSVTGFINSVPVSEFVCLNGSDLLRATELQNVTFNAVDTNNLEVGGRVNDIDVEDMIHNTMTYDGYEKVTGKKTIKGTIDVNKGDHLTVGTINGVNIGALWEDAVLLDVPQNISGTKIFSNIVSFDNLVFKKTIDGVSERDMNNWMLRDKPQVVEGDIVFSMVSVGNLNVKGYVNNLNITELDDSIVKVTKPNVIEGPITFSNVVISSGNIMLSGKIQGVDLFEECVTKSDPVITGLKTFTQDLVVEGSARVDGLVDGVDIDEICHKSLLINKEQRIAHLTIKGDVVLSGGGTIKGKVGGIDLSEFETSDGLKLIVSGKKTFRHLTIEGMVTVTGLFGAVDLLALNQTYMSLSRDQAIPARIEFEDATFEGSLNVGKLTTLNGMVNGENLRKINDRILMKSGHQTVTELQYFDEIIFSDVFVGGKVNGLNVPSGLMRHNETNFIQSPKVFAKPLTIYGNLSMQSGKRINNVDVSDWFEKAVQKNGGTFVIDGLKTFKHIFLADAKIEGLLGGLKMSEESLLMSYGNQVITGQKTVAGSIDIKGPFILTGLINGINLDDLANRTLQQNKENVVTGMKYFSKLLTIKDLEAPTVDGVNVTALQSNIHRNFDFGFLQNLLNEIEEVIEDMGVAISKQAVVFQYYELFDHINIPTAYNWLYVYGSDCGELLLLSEDSSKMGTCSTIVFYSFYENGTIYKSTKLQEFSFPYAVSIKSLYIWNTTYLFVANQNRYRCIKEENIGDITSSIYNWNGREFKLVQLIDTSELEDMVVFYEGNLCCVVYLGLQYSELYCSGGKDQDFKKRGQLLTKGAKRASIIDYFGEIIMAVVVENLDPSFSYTEKKPVEIFFWNRERSEFEVNCKPILSTYAQSVQLMSHYTEQSSNAFLTIAEGKIPRIQNEQRILIFRYDSSLKKFQKYQEIKDYGELEWIALETGELMLFALDSHVNEIKLYQYKGASGFVHIDTVKSVGSTTLHPFIRPKDPRDSINHYLALAGTRSSMAQGVEYATILKSKMKGRRLN